MSGKNLLNRRRFVQGVSAVAAAGLSGMIEADERPADQPASQDAATTQKNSRPEVAAIYCPLWHRYDHMDAWHGEGWCEWELLKSAPPRFPGHYQPLKPSWGLFDESDPKWAEREIDLAADHGIDVFIFDWYWYSGVKLMEEVLEGAFQKASNRQRMKFALMWANHTWCDYFPAPYDKPWNVWLPQRHSAADLMRVIDYCLEYYFREPNYWTVDGRLFLSMFAPHDFYNQLGGPAETRSLLKAVDARLHEAGLPPMHWNAMIRGPGEVQPCMDAGFASTTTYNVIDTGKTSPDYTQQYDDLIDRHHELWNALRETPLPHCPVVTMGWDVTPRCEHNIPFPFAKGNYPYMPVVINNTPERFEQLCRDAARHVADDSKHPFAVFINAWNEWTEGSYLLPEEKYGTAYLEAIRRAWGVSE